jgi:hypothetical protein
VRHSSAAFEQSRRERNQGRARAAFVVGLVAAASCTVYDQKLLEEAKGVGGTNGSGASGGSAASGGAGGTDGGVGASGGAAGSGTGGSAGGSGGAAGTTGGSGAGKAGSGGASGASAGGKAGSGGAGGSAGKGGNGGATSAGTAGTMMDGGEGGEMVDPCPGGDCCPNDAMKTMPGECGCGVADTDTDDDGTPDCNDMCVDDDTRTQPGSCGCDSMYLEADCAALKLPLVHRYSFNGSGAVIEDSVGDADGTLTQASGGTATQSGGVVNLPGGSTLATDLVKAYVALPTGCLDGLTNATFEAWVTWSMTCTQASCVNSTNWQRVFDFGEASSNTAGSNIFLTPRSSLSGNTVISASTTTGSSNELSTGHRADNASIVAGAHHFAVVVDDAGNQVSLYIDGVLAVPVVAANTGAYMGTLASITATNCWLGRSNYASDVYFNGSFNEFRIYDVALPKSAIDFSIAAGPNAPFL